MVVAPVFTDPARFWPVFVLIPLLGALLGFAVCALTARLRLVGIAPPGSVLRHRAQLAALHGQLVSDGLLSAQELFARVEPRRLAEEVSRPLLRAVDEIVVEVATQHRPGLWEMLPLRVKQLFIRQAREQATEMVVELTEEVSVDADEVCELEHLVRGRLDADADAALLRELTARITATVDPLSSRCGALLGLLLGGLALLVLGLTGGLWVLPLSGLVIGGLAYAFGPRLALAWFGRRRAEVARGYADVLAAEVLDFAGIVRELTTGPRSARLAELVRRLVHRRIDARLSAAKPLVVAGLGSRQYQELKQSAATKVTERIPELLRPAEGYVSSTMDVRNTIVHRVRGMPRQRYALLLRPVLLLDRWWIGPLWVVMGGIFGGVGMLLLGVG